MTDSSRQSTAIPRTGTAAAPFADKLKTAEDKRLTVEECRKILGPDCTDEEVRAIRDQLYALARISVTEFAKGLNSRETAQQNAQKAA